MLEGHKVGYKQLSNVCVDCCGLLRYPAVCTEKCPVRKLLRLIEEKEKKG